MGHIRSVKLAESTAAPAGSIFYNGVFYLAPQIQKHDPLASANLFKYKLLADIPTLS